MLESLPVSQLTLMRLQTVACTKCTVFCDLGVEFTKLSVSFNDETSVDGLISEAIKMMQDRCPALTISSDASRYVLFASKKSGRKISDLPSFEPKQKISMTGVKAFYMSLRNQSSSAKKNSPTASTRSIQSEIKQISPKKEEIKTSKHFGCFCFAK